MLLEVLAEERLVGEVHLLGYFLYVAGCVLKNDTELKCHIVVNPFVRSLTAHLLNHLREIFRSDAYLLGIPAYATLPLAVILNELYELSKDDITTSDTNLLYLLETIDYIAKVVEHSKHKSAHKVTTEMAFSINNLLLHQLIVVTEYLLIMLREIEDWVVVSEEEQS